tara:strand:- start:7 stop:162 length:156 start_codon:yes stop_codon:yes gene_type:complete
MTKNNNLLLKESLFYTNQENSYEIKNSWEEGDLGYQKNIAHLTQIFLISFK